MTSLKYERLRELEVALALKHRECDVLRSRCAEYRAEQKGAMNGLVEHCLNNAECVDALAAVPLEQLQNAIAQLSSQRLQEEKAAKIFLKTENETALEIREHEKEQQRLRERLEYMMSLTGMDHTRAEERLKELRQDSEATGSTALVPMQSRALAASLAPVEMRVHHKQLEAELHAAKVVKAHNEKALVELRAAQEKKGQVETRRCETLAQIQVAERDMREQRAQLKALVTEHEALDRHTKALEDNSDRTCRAILDRDSVTLRGRLDECVERRRLQERVLKAQQLRLSHLQSRLKTIEDALQRHGLSREVDLRIAEAEREAARAKGSDNAQLIQFPENEEEAFYDVEAIVPVEESIHPAIYSLFVQDRDRLQRRVSLQSVVLKEKAEAVDALEAKVAELAEEVMREEDRLHHLCNSNEKELNVMRAKVNDELQQQRDQYFKLVERSRQVQHKLLGVGTPRSQSCGGQSRSSSARK